MVLVDGASERPETSSLFPPWETQWEEGHMPCEPNHEPDRVGTLTLVFQPPELWAIHFCYLEATWSMVFYSNILNWLRHCTLCLSFILRWPLRLLLTLDCCELSCYKQGCANLSQDPISSSFGCIPKNEILRSCSSFIFNFLGSCQIVFYSRCTLLQSYKMYTLVSFFLHHHQHLLFSVVLVFIVTALKDMRWYLTMVLICIFLRITDVEYCFYKSVGHWYIIFGEILIWVLWPLLNLCYLHF